MAVLVAAVLDVVTETEAAVIGSGFSAEILPLAAGVPGATRATRSASHLQRRL
jgi:hypothetical protein